MAGLHWKNFKAQLSWLLSQLWLSVALLIISLYHPALQQMNGQSGLGEVTMYKHTDQEDSFEITGCTLSAKFSLSTKTNQYI